MNIQNHPQYTTNDYNYLKAKGWTNAEIKTRWDQEHKAGKPPCTWGSEMAQAKLQATLSPANSI